jgi:hypothetical protein
MRIEAPDISPTPAFAAPSQQDADQKDAGQARPEYEL